MNLAPRELSLEDLALVLSPEQAGRYIDVHVVFAFFYYAWHLDLRQLQLLCDCLILISISALS